MCLSSGTQREKEPSDTANIRSTQTERKVSSGKGTAQSHTALFLPPVTLLRSQSLYFASQLGQSFSPLLPV